MSLSTCRISYTISIQKAINSQCRKNREHVAATCYYLCLKQVVDPSHGPIRGSREIALGYPKSYSDSKSKSDSRNAILWRRTPESSR